MMQRRRTHATIRCPYRPTEDADPCEAPVHLVIDPPERRTWDYPGSGLSIASITGCPHADDLSEDILLDALADQEGLMTPRDWDDGRY